MTTILELHTKLKATEKYGLWFLQIVVDNQKYVVTHTPDRANSKFILAGYNDTKDVPSTTVVTRYRFVNKKWIKL